MAAALFAPSWWSREPEVVQGPEVPAPNYFAKPLADPQAPLPPAPKELAKSQPGTRAVPEAPRGLAPSTDPDEMHRKRALLKDPKNDAVAQGVRKNLAENKNAAEPKIKQADPAPAAGPGGLAVAPAAPHIQPDAKPSEKAQAVWKDAERVMVVELQLSSSGPSKEALRDFFAWQGIDWQANDTRAARRDVDRENNAVAQARGALAAPSGGTGGTAKGASYAAAPAAPPDIQLGRAMAKGEAGEGIEAVDRDFQNGQALEVVYLETTPKQWREMAAVLKEWKGAQLNLVAANAKDRDSLRYAAKGEGKGEGGASIYRGEKRADPQMAAAPNRAQAEGAALPAKPLATNPAPSVPAGPMPPADAIAANPANANFGRGREPGEPAAALKTELQAADKARQDSREKSDASRGIAFPYSHEAARQIASRVRSLQSDDRRDGAAAADGNANGSSEGLHRSQLPSPPRGFAAEAESVTEERVRIVLVIRPEEKANAPATLQKAEPAAPAAPK
jgi:hypothetical protein